MKRLFLLIAFVCLQNAFGQIISEEFNSSRLNDKRKIAIYLPEGYSDKEAYPLFVVLDAVALMEPTIAAARYYEYLQSMPKSIIVGVFNTNTDISIASEVGHPMNETAQFFEFIGTELVPYIKGKYPINTLRGIIASEEAAYFASHYLLSDKPLFNALIALNPKVQSYIKESLPEQFTKARHHKFCYIATTDMESDETLKEIEDLDIRLKKAFNKNINYNYEKFVATSPESADLMGIARGFDLLFDIYKPITAKEFKEKIQPLQENIFQYLGEKYTRIYNELGVRKKPSLNDIFAIYDAIHKREDWLSLSDLSDFVKANGYSDTAMPNFFLGEYYEKIEDYKKATRAYQRAYGEPSIDFIKSDLINERITNLRGK